MKIALLAHLRHPIARPFAGGMEAHSWLLAKGLEARGHQVTVFAAGDSDPTLRLHAVIDRHYEAILPWAEHRSGPELTAYLDEAYARACLAIADGGFDVLHNNSLHRFPLRTEWTDRTPTVTSLHVPPYPALHGFVSQSPGPRHALTVTSGRQMQAWFPDGASDQISVLYNGVDLPSWPFQPKALGGAAWSGRITPDKGAHLALDAAALLGLPITLYGPIDDQVYWTEMIQPRLMGRAAYGGHLTSEALAHALRQAQLFFFTPMWDEPFGLAAVEAMACGAPVAALDNGAAREIIADGGVIAETSTSVALADAAEAALQMPRTAARARAEVFSLERWLDGCEALYARVTGRDCGGARA